MSTASPEKRRWARSERFALSPAGVQAEADYRARIGRARLEGGRASFEAARREWADSLGLEPDDGACLGEFSAGPVSLTRLVDVLDGYGHTRTDAVAALGRLWDAGLVCASVKP